ncbi:ABC transporter ATP-binding protein [Marinilactibacillus kalidii]|uniref:ABC transporter ATP-binding protein n=1 Tax=Marinilactibacillus kalidii TaxID=2820274 RepID=UPI001ABE3867|nr:ABC transporter ATP-binding protein [Marinilactibacillus kalidii]
MKLFIHYLKPLFARMFGGLSVKFVGTIMDLFLPLILAYIIDSVIPTGNINRVLLWGGAMVLCSIIAVTLSIKANRMASGVARDAVEQIRHDLYEKITYLSASQADQYGTPSLISRLTSDTYNLHRTIGLMQRIGVRAPVLLIGGILMTVTLDPVLTLVMMGVLPFATVTIYYVSKKGVPLFDKLQQEVDKLVRTVRENITGARVIKALSKTDYEKIRFEGVNQGVVNAETSANKTMAATTPLMNLFLNIGLTCVVLTSAYRVNEGLTQPGVIIAFMTYFTIILNAMLSITRIFVLFSKGIASADRIHTILQTEPELTVQPIDEKEDTAHVRFDHVSFGYEQNHTVKDIDFALEKGETLGIIGATGSGKTTIIKLLLRLYDVDSGSIRIDGRNINSMHLKELHTKFGVTFQSDFLYADTLSENIDFGRQLPEEDILQSTEAAQAEEFIDSLDHGVDHRLTANGTNLSGGQKQRVLLSRALAGDPEVLVLDDSSSALDYKTDANLRKALNEGYQETTTIMIAQRISSIQQADQIMMLDKGRIIGKGTHKELMQSCEPYKEIYFNQSGGEEIA